jgi:hypothetical protein
MRGGASFREQAVVPDSPNANINASEFARTFRILTPAVEELVEFFLG